MPEIFNRYAGEVRERIIKELRMKFSMNPKWRHITNDIVRAFPIIDPRGEKRLYPSESIIVTNASNSMQRLAADNAVGTYFSFLTKIDFVGGKKGLFLNWIEEDTYNLLILKEEDVSSSINENKLYLSKYPIVNEKNAEITYNPNHIKIYQNGIRIFPQELNGRTGEVIFGFDLTPGTYTARYFYRNLEAIGVYQIEVTKDFKDDENVPPQERLDFEFYIDPVYKRDELLTSSLNGTSTFQLACPVLEVAFGDGLKGYALEIFMDRTIRLIAGTDYLFDANTNSITILSPPVVNGSEITASYRTEGQSIGPFKQTRNTYNNSALKGVILAFGDQIEIGDKAYIEISDSRQPSAQVYGSLWQISLDLQINAKDPNNSIELCKLVHQYIEMDLRPSLSFEGIEIEEVSMGGESNETYLDNTGDPYFSGSISINCKSFWEQRFPIYGSFTAVFPEMFYILDPSKTYYYISRPNNTNLLIPIGESEYSVPKNYPAFSGKIKDPLRGVPVKNVNNLNPPPVRGAPNNLIGFF